MVSAGFRGELDSAVSLPPASEAPAGICTVRRGPRGRAPPTTWRLFDLDGGVRVVSGIDDMDVVRVLSVV